MARFYKGQPSPAPRSPRGRKNVSRQNDSNVLSQPQHTNESARTGDNYVDSQTPPLSPRSDVTDITDGSVPEDKGLSETTTPSQPCQTIPAFAALDWNGPDDPENPLNWSTWKRTYCSISIGLLSLAVTFGSSVYAPAIPQIMEEFDVSSTVALLGITVYVFSLALGPMIAAPLSEAHGRVIVYRLTIPLSMLFTLGAGFSQTLTQLLVCRFFAGMIGAGVLAIGAGRPLVGGFTVMHKSWRWTQWDSLFMTLCFYILSLPLSESYKPIILRRCAKRMNTNIMAPPGPKGLQALNLLLTITLARPILMLIREPIVLFLSLYTAYAFAVLFAFFEAIPIIFTTVYGFNAGQCGLVFLAFAIGFGLASLTGLLADMLIYRKKHAQAARLGTGVVAPEERLHPAMWGSVGIPLGLFMLAWTSRADIHWICPVLSAIPFGWGIFTSQISTVLYLGDVYGMLMGASAIAANGFLRYGLASVFPLFIVQMYERLHVTWAMSVFGFVSLGLMPIPWVFFKYGASIRARSRYEAAKD